MPVYETIFPERLRAIRKARGLTQMQVGKLIGLGEAVIGHFEKGRQQPSFRSLCLLAEALDVSLDHLVGNERPSDNSIPAWIDAMLADLCALDSTGRDAVKALVKGLKKS